MLLCEGKSMRRAFLLSATVAVALAMIFQQRSPLRAEPSADAAPPKSAVDRFILQRLNEEKITPSALCSDEEFCRRTYLDVCGVIPTLDQVKSFCSGKDPLKREKLIDALLDSPRYAAHWAVMWSDLLRDNTNSKSYRDWLRGALRANVPYDLFAKKLIAGSGNIDDNPAARFIVRDEGNPVELVNTVSNVFMGTRMACAQCHDHPFDKWTQDDFHGVMAFFTRTAVQNDPVATLERIELDPEVGSELKTLLKGYFDEAHREEFRIKQKSYVSAADDGLSVGMVFDGAFLQTRDILKDLEPRTTKENVEALRKILQTHNQRMVFERSGGEYRMPTEGDGIKKQGGGEIVPAVFPWDPAKKTAAPGSRRKPLADFVAGSRRFAEVQVNRLWAQVMGRGLIEPRDDFREKNPASHPELLEYLTDQFILSKYDNKHALRLILNSDTYQRSSAPKGNERDTTLFSHARARRMSAEQFYDSIIVATGHENGVEYDASESANAKGRIRWAADIPVPAQNGSLLNLLNQPNREQTTPQREEAASIPQALELMNGHTLNDAVRNGPLAEVLLRSKLTPAQSIEQIYLATLARKPTPREVERLTKGSAALTREWLEDISWALLNTSEFSYIR
jgi:hypothetical protein